MNRSAPCNEPADVSSLRDREPVSLGIGARAFARVRIARSFFSRFVGLLGRSSLAIDEGLLFYPGGSIHTAWMRFAIDVVFLDHNLRVLRVVQEVKPWRVVIAPRGTRYVLELAAGVARGVGIEHGATLQTCRQELTVIGRELSE